MNKCGQDCTCSCHQTLECPTIDGESFWRVEVDRTKIDQFETALMQLQKAFNDLHYSREKPLMMGLTMGLHGYLNMLKKGK